MVQCNNRGLDKLAPIIKRGRIMKATTGFLFGHYDSRGGATLVLGVANMHEAIERYVKEGFVTTEDDSWYDDYFRHCSEEIMAACVVTYDERLVNRSYLDFTYGNTIYGWALVADEHLRKWEYEDGEVDFEYDPDKIMEIRLCHERYLTKPREGFRWHSLEVFGEDAFGLIVLAPIPKPEKVYVVLEEDLYRRSSQDETNAVVALVTKDFARAKKKAAKLAVGLDQVGEELHWTDLENEAAYHITIVEQEII